MSRAGPNSRRSSLVCAQYKNAPSIAAHCYERSPEVRMTGRRIVDHPALSFPERVPRTNRPFSPEFMKIGHQSRGLTGINTPETGYDLRHAGGDEWTNEANDAFASIIAAKRAFTRRKHHELCILKLQLIHLVKVQVAVRRIVLVSRISSIPSASSRRRCKHEPRRAGFDLAMRSNVNYGSRLHLFTNALFGGLSIYKRQRVPIMLGAVSRLVLRVSQLAQVRVRLGIKRGISDGEHLSDSGSTGLGLIQTLGQN